MSYTPYRASKSVFYTLCIRSPAFNYIKMAWVAGLGIAQLLQRAEHRRAEELRVLRGLREQRQAPHRVPAHLFFFLAKHLPSWLPSPENWTVLHDKPFRPVGEKRSSSHVGVF